MLHLEGEVPAIAAPNMVWVYRAQLRGHSLTVDLVVGDDYPASFVEFFESIAQDWQGWSETRGYESFDGTLSITATHDRMKSVRFEVRFRGDARSGFDWSATHRLTVQVGHLRKLADAATTFAT